MAGAVTVVAIKIAGDSTCIVISRSGRNLAHDDENNTQSRTVKQNSGFSGFSGFKVVREAFGSALAVSFLLAPFAGQFLAARSKD